MGTACFCPTTLDPSPQITIDNQDSYPPILRSSLIEISPSKQDISNYLVQQSKQFDDEVDEEPLDNCSISTPKKAISTNLDSLYSMTQQLPVQLESKSTIVRGILKQQNSQRTLISNASTEKKVRFVKYSKSKFK